MPRARDERAVDPVTAYALKVVEEEPERHCKLERLACERHLRDLREGEARGLRFDIDRALHAIRFFGFLRHWKGEWRGRSFVLSPWQQFVVGCVFGWVWIATGFRRFQLVYECIPRKNGKSAKLGGVGLYLLMADREPAPEVYSAATKRDQARIVHGHAIKMRSASPALRRRTKLKRDLIEHPASDGIFLPLGADADTIDGLHVHGAIIDELHKHKTRAIFDVLDTGMGARRQPLIWEITTAGEDEEGICYEHHDYSRQVLEGVLEDDTWFAYITTVDDEEAWDDPAEQAKANPNLGVSVKAEDLARQTERARSNPAARAAFKQKRLNLWVGGLVDGVDVAVWKRQGGEPLQESEFYGRRCFTGVDLSSKLDLSAAVHVFPPEREGEAYTWLARFWCPEERLDVRAKEDRVPYPLWREQGWLKATPGNIIDYDAIEADLLSDRERFDIEELDFDPWNAFALINRLRAEGMNAIEIRQGMASLAPLTKEFDAEVHAGRIRHGNNPIMNWCAANLRYKKDDRENKMPIKRHERKRIDGMVAGLMATGRAVIVNEDRGTVYDRGGELMVV